MSGKGDYGHFTMCVFLCKAIQSLLNAVLSGIVLSLIDFLRLPLLSGSSCFAAGNFTVPFYAALCELCHKRKPHSVGPMGIHTTRQGVCVKRPAAFGPNWYAGEIFSREERITPMPSSPAPIRRILRRLYKTRLFSFTSAPYAMSCTKEIPKTRIERRF